MYEYLLGEITEVHPEYLVIEVNGVGFRVQVANPYSYPLNEQATKIYVYQAVRDDAISLFGFHSADEKQLFTKLLAVSGIGPKSALAILANPDHEGLVEAIANNNVSYITKFPGIGKKTASRIIVELQDKVDSLLPTLDLQPKMVDSSTNLQDNAELADAVAALKALGYSTKDVKKAATTLKKESGLSTDQYLRKGLTLLS
ncbi:Holliday junction branch migration protein RuvA [uncultured Limosilactobacillus sp.]|uniref:Holliday junction branch migration protein RuvA n=1 Tax=uncultured Limosilactobacillus sp. TaxID=2837629 RepID=UPI0025F605D0|nr:Holliday junction branch migration protein RuvA [uncultured Limosilactobacillus sp.]